MSMKDVFDKIQEAGLYEAVPETEPSEVSTSDLLAVFDRHLINCKNATFDCAEYVGPIEEYDRLLIKNRAATLEFRNWFKALLANSQLSCEAQRSHD